LPEVLAMTAARIVRIVPRLALVLVLMPGLRAVTVGVAAEPARRPTLVLITPGTRVPGPRPLPAGWTHLVIKSMPRLASGELDSLPSVAQSTATLFRATLLAEVRPVSGAGPPYELRRIGIGLCTPIKGVDTIVTAATANQLNAGLGYVERRVLAEAERELLKGRVKARTPTFALYTAPSTRKAGTGHEDVFLRYALLVDPNTGDLRTVFWAQPRGQKGVALERFSVLPPGLVFDAALDVRAQRVLNTVPVNWSFAMSQLPSGTRLKPTPALREWAVRDTLSPSEAAAFEAELRRVVAAALASEAS
jgi:hypothetical protein